MSAPVGRSIICKIDPADATKYMRWQVAMQGVATEPGPRRRFLLTRTVAVLQTSCQKAIACGPAADSRSYLVIGQILRGTERPTCSLGQVEQHT